MSQNSMYVDLFKTIDYFNEMAWCVDNAQNFMINKSMKNYMGVDNAECIESMQDLWNKSIHPDYIDLQYMYYEDVLKLKEAKKCKILAMRYDGEYRWIEIKMTPILNDNKEVLGLMAMCRDITEERDLKEKADSMMTFRLEYEEELQKREEKFRKIFYNAVDMMFLAEFNSTTLVPVKFIELNQKTCDILEYTEEELLLANPSDIFGEEQEYSLQIDNDDNIEMIWKTQSGKKILVEVNNSVIQYDDNSYMLFIARDITEKRKEEILFQESQKRYHKLLMNLPIGFAYCSFLHDDMGNVTDFEFVDVNDVFSEIQDIVESEILSKAYISTKSGVLNDIGSWKKILDEVSENGEVMRFEEIYSEELDKFFSLIIFSTEDDNFAILVSDISGEKKSKIKMEKALEDANAAYKAKSEFLANMSHEIRTPLNGIIGMLELTLFNGDLNREYTENLTTAKSCAEGLREIINDILDFSKMEAGKTKIELITFNLEAFIKKIIKIHHQAAVTKGIDFKSFVPEDISQDVVGDPTRVQQILNNLLSNAVKFTSRGFVSLSVKIKKSYENEVHVAIAIRDSGIGIAKESMNKLFQSFSQVDASHTRRFGGTGLGLAISQNLARLMNGEITVASEEGIGSTFTLDIILKKSSKKSFDDGVVDEDIVFKRDVDAFKLLIVDDDKLNRVVMARMIDKIGYSYDIADNGKSALEFLKEKHYDLCLMDVQMPEIDGVTVLKIYREFEKNNDKKYIPIVAVTAHALSGDKERFIEQGMDDYMAKPFQFNELVNMIDKFCKGEVDNTVTSKELAAEEDISTLIEEKRNASLKVSNPIDRVSQIFEELNGKIMMDNISTFEEAFDEIKLIGTQIEAKELKKLAFKAQLSLRRSEYEKAEELLANLILKFKDLR